VLILKLFKNYSQNLLASHRKGPVLGCISQKVLWKLTVARYGLKITKTARAQHLCLHSP
jgi:hypothetical protein